MLTLPSWRAAAIRLAGSADGMPRTSTVTVTGCRPPVALAIVPLSLGLQITPPAAIRTAKAAAPSTRPKRRFGPGPVGGADRTAMVEQQTPNCKDPDPGPQGAPGSLVWLLGGCSPGTGFARGGAAGEGRQANGPRSEVLRGNGPWPGGCAPPRGPRHPPGLRLAAQGRAAARTRPQSDGHRHRGDRGTRVGEKPV